METFLNGLNLGSTVRMFDMNRINLLILIIRQDWLIQYNRHAFGLSPVVY